MSKLPPTPRWLAGLFAFLLVSAWYLFTFPQPNVFYAVMVFLHVIAGVAASTWLAISLYRLLKESGAIARAGWVCLATGAVLGLVLIKTGTLRSDWNWLYAHIVLSLGGVGILFAERRGKSSRLLPSLARVAVVWAVIASAGAGAWYLRNARWQNRARIENPMMPPASMDGEGDGPKGPFFPSSAQVYGSQKIPSKFFMESDSCKRCHQDIYSQWFSSAHHFSSFNNQWYRKSIEYMQDTEGTKPSKWCGGCHDPAVLYAGLMDTPIKKIVHRPEAQAGLGCMMCHSIADEKHDGPGRFLSRIPQAPRTRRHEKSSRSRFARFPDS